MQQYRGQWSFGAEQKGQDGVTYNLQFEGYRDALHAWRYPDFTRHVSFLADALDLTTSKRCALRRNICNAIARLARA